MMSLRETYIEATVGGKPAAVAALCEEFGVSRSRAGEWLNGVRRIPDDAQRFMRECCLPRAILAAGGIPPDDAKVDDLAAMLSP